MKILLFNLGTIEHRIIGWGIEGFKSLFEQDIILWGPVPDEKLVYENKEIPILRFFEPISILEVFRKLPDGWYPDIVTCETSVLNYVTDIYLCPVKTILFTRDAWSDTIFNRKIVELFDFINHATIDRQVYAALDVNLLPLSNCAVSLPVPGLINAGFEKREIDVIAISNYNASFYHDRYKTLYKLSDSNKNGIDIRYYTGIDRPEIYTYYQRSKIVIDWAHTLSNRSYEAAMNGCLLFSHEDNQLIKDFWIPWKEYIPYNEQNVLELVEYYINNPEESKQIISNVQQKVKKLAPSWGEYVWENIMIASNIDISIADRIRKFESKPLAELYYCSATPLLFNYEYKTNFPVNWKELYFERIDNCLLNARSQNDKISPLIEASRAAFLFNLNELSLKYLRDLEKILPDYAWIYYLHARIYSDEGDNNAALDSINKSIDCAGKAPWLIQQYVLPVIEDKNACDGRRITSYMWQSVLNHKNEFQVNSLKYLALELSGDIYLRTGDFSKATDAYCEAINNVPVPNCIYKVCPLLISQGKFEQLSDVTQRGIENSPYDSRIVLYKAYSLLRLGQKQEALRILKDHKRALKSFFGYRKILYLRKSLNFVYILALINNVIGAKAILEVIKYLLGGEKK